MKFNNNGQRIWGTYIGSGKGEQPSGIYIDGNDHIYAALLTGSDSGLASSGAEYPSVTNANNTHICLFKFNNNGQRIWSTYINSNGDDYAYSITGDTSENIYLSGITNSTQGITTSGTFQPSFIGNHYNGFLLKCDSSGYKTWGTYYGQIFSNFSYVLSRNSLQISQSDPPYLYIGLPTPDINTNTPTSCTYPALNTDGLLGKFDTAGNLIWSSLYDAGISSLTLTNDKQIYVGAHPFEDNLATAGAFRENKGNSITLITRLTDTLRCPQLTLTITQTDTSLSVPQEFAIYSWYKNDSLISQINSNLITITPADSGIYMVRVQDSCGCIYTSNRVSVNNGTGVGNINEIEGLTIYPNPAHDNIFILSENNMNPQYEITDLTGRSIYKGNLLLNSHQPKSIHIRQLAPGSYFLHIYQKEKQTVIKMIKN